MPPNPFVVTISRERAVALLKPQTKAAVVLHAAVHAAQVKSDELLGDEAATAAVSALLEFAETYLEGLENGLFIPAVTVGT